MSLPKLYDPMIVFNNDAEPALNEDNLNAISQALSDIDDRVIQLGSDIMEGLPEIREDIEILEPAVENIDENVARAEAAADTAEQYVEEIEEMAPPIEVVKDFAPIITMGDAINKPVKDLKVKVDAVQDLHGYTKPWVGGAGKNKLAPFITSGLSNGVTWSLKDDGTATSSGTASPAASQPQSTHFTLPQGNYFLSGCPTGGSGTTYFLRILGYDSNNTAFILGTDTGAGVAFTIDNTVVDMLVFASVNNGVTAPSGTWKPMIESGASGTTYERYTNISPITGHSEAKVTRVGHNLLETSLEIIKSLNTEGTWNGNTYTFRNGAFTVNNDMSITVANNGIGSSAPYFYITRYRKGNGDVVNPCSFYGKEIIASGCPSGGSSNTYKLRLQSGSNDYFDYGSGTEPVIFTPTASTEQVYLQVYSTAPSILTFKPMIRLATDTNTTFEPYMGEIFTIDLDGTRYSCVLDMTSGVLTVLGYFKEYDETANIYANNHRFGIDLSPASVNAPARVTCMCNLYEPKGASDLWSNRSTAGYAGITTQAGYCYIVDNVHYSNYDATDVAAFKASLEDNPLQLLYELATPITVQLTPEEIELLFGYNTLFADTGDLSLTYDASGVLRIANAKLDIDTFKSVVAASSDFADFKSRVAAL